MWRRTYINIHCKNELTVFPSPAGMSLIKLFLGGNNLVFFRPERVWSVTSRLGTGKWLTLFYSVDVSSSKIDLKSERRLCSSSLKPFCTSSGNSFVSVVTNQHEINLFPAHRCILCSSLPTILSNYTTEAEVYRGLVQHVLLHA
jgi:hypothetical protein